MKTSMIILSLSFISSAISTVAFASLDMKPGLWTVQTQVTEDGKTHEPRVEMQKSMKDLTPEQRAQVEATMKKMGAGLGDDGLKVCYTREMIANDKALSRHGKECKNDYTTKTSSKVVGTFQCNDGSKGEMEWKLSGSDQYTGNVKLEREGKKSDIAYTGKFVSANCGDVKPIETKVSSQ